MLKKVLHVLDHVLYPEGIRCLLCGEPAYGETFCQACRESLDRDRMQEPLCPRCGSEMKGETCGFCAERQLPVMGIRSAWHYQDAAARLVAALKFRSLTRAAECMAEPMAEAAQKLNLPQNTVVTWVTMPQKRRRQRGIDHGRLIAEAVAGKTGLQVRQLLERKAGSSEYSQRGLNAEERRRNLKGGFVGKDCRDIPVLLVDDVFTTGSTISECAETLTAAGCSGVWALTATRVTDE